MADYDIGAAFEAIEKELMDSMVRNLKRHRAEEGKEGIEWSQWQAEQLAALERYKRDNRKRYGGVFRSINGMLEEIIRQSYSDGQNDQEASILNAILRGADLRRSSSALTGAFFRTNQRKLDELVKATTADMERAETAILRRTDDQYRKVIFNAQVYANTGAGTYEKAVDMATRDFLAAGIKSVVYADGSVHSLSDYADMALRTASKRAYLSGEGVKRQEWGVSTVIVNKRSNACPHCAKFCGKVFIDDVWSGGKRGDGNYPLLSRAVAEGLYHPRCKDSHATWFPELHEDAEPYTPEEIARLEQAEERELRQQHAQRQAKKYRRMAEYSLDAENQAKYSARASEWEEISSLDKASGTGGYPGKKKASGSGNDTRGQWDDRIGSQAWDEASRKRIWKTEWSSTYKREECGMLYDADGKLLFRQKGDASSVHFTAAQIKQMRGGVLTHNHPGANYGCFSPADINMLRYGKLSEVRVVTPKGIFSIQRPKKWPSSIGSLEKMTEVYYDVFDEVMPDYMERAAQGEMTYLEADNQGQAAVVQELCRRYGIPFRYDSWDDIREVFR